MTLFNFNLNRSIINYINHWNSFPNLFPNYPVISVNRYIIKNNSNYVLNLLQINKYLCLICCLFYWYKQYGEKTD